MISPVSLLRGVFASSRLRALGNSPAIAIVLALLAAPLLAAAPATEPLPKIKIILVGDSTVEDKAGWGPGFEKLLDPAAQCLNRARGGRSSKSYINEGHWKKALAEKPDYVLIQFGHNDEPGKGPERETDPATTYPQWMARYVDEARAAGARPVLVTSLSRRIFDHNGKIRSSLVPYAEAVKKLAAEKHVPLIDLHALSIAYLEKIGPQASKELDYKKPLNPDGTRTGDVTHLSPKGADVFGKMVAEELKKVVPELAPYVKTAP